YTYQPKASVSRDGRKLVYSSNFGLQSILGYPKEYSDAYMIDLSVASSDTFGTAYAVSPPTADYVAPSSGSGLSEIFQFVFSDPAGYKNSSFVGVPFGATNGLANRCFLYYSPPPLNLLYVMNDSGTAWADSGGLGANRSIGNSQCRIDLSRSSVARAG